MTYWPGLTPESCGLADSLTLDQATADAKTYELSAITSSQNYTCYYLITADTDQWQSTANISLRLDSFNQSVVYVYAGTGRTNATLVIEDDEPVALNGASVTVPISSGLIIVLSQGTAQFTYQVVGDLYTWYEAPFIGLWEGFYIMFQVAFGFGLILALSLVAGLLFGPTYGLMVLQPLSQICLFALCCCWCCCCRCCRDKRSRLSSQQRRQAWQKRNKVMHSETQEEFSKADPQLRTTEETI